VNATAVLIGLGIAVGVAAALAILRLPAPQLRVAGGAALVAAALGLAAMRQFALAAPAGLLGIALLRAGAAAARAAPRPGQSSEVRTEALAMRLDHDSGDMDGEVLAGRFAGAYLSQLGLAELRLLADELEDDPDSLGLLLAYIDRRRAAAGAGAEGAEAPRREEDGGAMSAAEALRILGLAPGASLEEIRAAHRRLMKRVHPDLGGSDALAAMINAAKARLDP
jgi:hypothetical protein